MTPQPLFGPRKTLNPSVKKKLRGCSHVILFLDFDGTLAPIRRTPSLATLSPRMKSLLDQLSARPDVTLALVTGRSRQDILTRVHIDTLLVMANHGFEIAGGRSEWIHPVANAIRPLLAKVDRTLTIALKPVRNILIENKRYTLSVHFRNVPGWMTPLVKNTVEGVVRPYAKLLKTAPGKKVIEVRPNVDWSKGHAVIRVLETLRPSRSVLVVYIGDDLTDEDAFRMLPRSAIKVLVGTRRASAASYSVRDPRDVARFLDAVHSARLESTGQ